MYREAEPILVLTMGGTIDKEYFDALSSYQVGSSVVRQIVDTARMSRPVLVVEVLRKDSLDMTDKDRDALVGMVRASALSRIIITHGTDTMIETAAALAGIEGKTIALVGAMAPARFHESDAAFNLGMAVAVVQTVAPGVYITMNGAVFPAGLAVKDRERQMFVARDAA